MSIICLEVCVKNRGSDSQQTVLWQLYVKILKISMLLLRN